jgi:hypothetical protein
MNLSEAHTMKTKIQFHPASLLRNTMITVSKGKCGHAGYREAQIQCRGGRFYYIITDGYEWLGIERGGNPNLKSMINIVEGILVDAK